MPELREALEAAVNEAETAAPEPVVTETPAAPSGEVSGGIEALSSVETPATETPAGEVKPAAEAKPAEPKPAEPKPADVKPEPGETQEEANKRAHRVDRAPQSWKGDAKGEWAALPLRVRQEVHRREAEVNRVMQESHTAREVAGQFGKVISPFMGRIKSYNVSPLQAVEELFKADYILGTGTTEQRAEHMAKLIKSYGVDLNALDSALVRAMGGQPQGGQAPQGGVDIEQRVMQKVQELLNPVMQTFQQNQQAQQQAQQQIQQEASMTVEQMSLDPTYPHFEEVRQDMADLIEIQAKRGVYLSLEDAYSRSVAMNPQLSQQMNAATLHQNAQKAKGASLSISGAPAMGGAQTPSGDGSLRGAIEAAFSGARI
jgi:hypothetical protein